MVRNALGSAALLLGVSAALASGFAGSRPAALETDRSAAGVCHDVPDPMELLQTVSDTSPAVPCSRPHTLETAFQLNLDGRLAAQRRRPNPELLTATWNPLCLQPDRIRDFLAATPPDVYWGIDVYPRYPTPAEWAHGVRLVDCDLAATGPGSNGPTTIVDLAGALGRAGSAAFRRCRQGGVDVTCDHPHDGEAVAPDVILADGPWPGDALGAAQAEAMCAPVVEDYLGRPLGTDPTVAVQALVPSEPAWNRGVRSLTCWVGPTSGTRTGTLRGGAA